MINISNKEICCGCHSCFSTCPQDAIKMVSDYEGFLYPEVDGQLCINCKKCERSCPMLVSLNKENRFTRSYAAWHNDDTIRTASSSGGIFSALMKYISKRNGIVIGAAFDDNMTLRHQHSESPSDTAKFRGSKYLQSTIDNTYFGTKLYLKSGRLTLFSGIPCQITGLYTYLGKDYPNL
ncbi:coenzyme F420 hydrogenase/dehydrogenase beta subunit N-terminal domain-containing protein [Desulfopila aestuarii]|uniref:4Fe-4S dicluster domain-containing protein n=1 Tax=Desulfopila aestuarii DSM 18488 TaxID=1121416 RepID=A0A1M7YFQ0_9BACT|nr:coenzyme F420 hydrogenase/dehydrogenase beta subunit N-terminal domain-containing protein [Desulfopila aestuarii]SHO51462.1 4Fe-4S dicluster domain-containing protein [Desulfopila aestuarii DSM 18488]